MFGIKLFKVGDAVRPNDYVFKDCVFPNGSVIAKIQRIEKNIIYLEDMDIPFNKNELIFIMEYCI